MYSMAMHRLDSAVNTALCPMLTTRARAAPTPTISEVTIGVPVRAETLPRTPWNGSAFCLAMEYIIRAPEVCQASVQTMIAITTSARMMRPAVPPKTASTTNGRPTVPRVPAVRLGAALSAGECAPVTGGGEGPPPRNWKPGQIDGSTAWSAMAAAATVRVCPMIMTQPVNQPNVCPASRDDHWKIAPEIGKRAAKVEK